MGTTTMARTGICMALVLLVVPVAAGEPTPPVAPGFEFINNSFENAAPLFWDIGEDGTIAIHLIYDYERASPNRANGHWLFQVQGQPGAELTLELRNFENVWNGKTGSPISDRSHCYTSVDGRQWNIIPAEKTKENRLRFRLKMDGPAMYVARLEPYRLSDLDRLLQEIRNHPLVAIETIGRTVEGRELEIIRVGRADAPHRVVMRARAHAWEPGGNWVGQGMIRRLLKDDDTARQYRDRFCLYVMPMANKDGVARGRTRFNSLGKDLNRQWDKPADPQLAPENHALEQWLERMIQRGQRPDLAIDWHNDNGGNMHLSRPATGLEEYLARMRRIEDLMRKHTWFTEGATGANFRNPGSIGEGLLERYGIPAFVQELNCDWIAGLNKPPTGRDWEQLGEQMLEVFCRYFENAK